MELHEALSQISQIREQIGRTQVFRGYRAFTVGLSGGLALAAAAVQPLIVADPLADLAGYLGLWVSLAAVCLAVFIVEVVVRAKTSQCAWTCQRTVVALEQLLPCVLAGAVVTVAIAVRVPSAAWLLPGLWCVLFGLGIFSSRQVAPPAMALVGVWYMACGVACLLLGEAALSPWMMGVPFGVGQLASAAVLHLTRERGDG